MRKILFIVLTFRFFDLVFPYWLSHHSQMFNREVYLSIFHWPPDSVITGRSYYKTFDAQHYLYLAEKWYSKKPIQQNAFFPLFPFLIKVFSIFTRSFFWSGIILSNIFSLVALYFLFLYLRETKREIIPIFILLLSFPSSFFFTRIYTESLFFLLLVLFMYAIRKKMKFLVFFVSLLLPLSRPQGVVVGVVAFFMYIFNKEKRQLFLASLLGFATGGIVYVLVMYLSAGDIFAALHAQKLYPRVNPLEMLMNPYRWIKENFIRPSYALRYLGPGNFIYERIMFLFLILALIGGYRHLSKEEFIMLLVLGLFSALTDHFMSFSRFLLPVFPLYIALWSIFKHKRMLYYTTVAFFTFAHVFLLSLHSLCYFVG